jgi:pyridinium-3,5-biscarboxylic acid mononucleotide sulfurtransferase
MLPDPARPGLQGKIDKAIHIISQFNGAIVALSAGVDSSLVAALAHEALGNRVAAITAVSESLAPGELEIAKETARDIGIRHVVVKTDEVHNANYKINPSNRCYYCKDTLYRELRSQADKSGFEAILDGTQLDDLGDTRPGLVAAREAGVRSPLAESGFSKEDVRDAARHLGLEVWDKPAMPCLSSRIPHGEEITVEKLTRVGEAESIVKRLSGARDIRVRHRGTTANVEVSLEELRLFRQDGLMKQIESQLRFLGFTSVTFGPRKHVRRPNGSTIGDEYILPIVNAPNHGQ